MINVNMRGVNWRQKIQNSVEHFHEVVGINVVDLYNLILQHDIHILLNWDGFSNAGIRIGGIFSLSPAPIQINHQEYIGTMGADYIQYFISDNTTTPKRYRKYFSEKMILVPYTLLATSMAYLGPEMKPPSRTSSRPEMNGCHGSPSSFTYCNMNKHMKFTPDLFKEWVKILETVPNSVLCLLENPPQAQESIRDFLSRLNNSLQGRVRYSPFIVNPYDNLQRVKDQCNAVLDTPVYSGHTTNADALWGGVPVVTFGDSVDACGRVGQSMLTSLGLHDLIARNQSHYTEIAIRLAMNKTFYRAVRHQLVDTCLQTSPPHPYWDLRRYTAALETGFTMAFHRFVDGQIPRDIVITEEFEGISNIKTSGKVDPTRHVPIAFRASCSDRMDDVIRLSYSSDAYENKQKTTATINARPQKSSTSKNDKTAASDARPRSNKLKDVPYDQMDTSEASSERPESKRKGKKQHRTKRVKRKHSKKRTRPSNDEL
jgi:protein O-GlcNAc transferase